MPLDPDYAQGLVDQYGSIKAAARAMSHKGGHSFGAIRDALQKKNKQHGQKPSEVRIADETVEDSERIMARLKDEIARANKTIGEIRKEEDNAARIREVIYGLAEVDVNPPIWTHEHTKVGVPGIPMGMWSDWHWSEVVRPEEVGYVNEFNSEIAAQRVRKLVDKTIELTVHHMVNPDYPGIIINLGGDMISGNIHEELRNTNDQYLLPSCMDVQDNIAAGLERLLEVFPYIFVPCVPGNHGRMSIKPIMKGRVYTSYEWNIYCQLERYFRTEPRVKFYIPNDADASYRVYDHRFHLTHGDSLGVKGGDGIIGAIGPIMRGAIKVGRSESQIGRDFDTILMGHWHQQLDLPGIKVNGALKGYDEYARLGLRVPYARPSQGLWFQHPQHGVTANWNIYLERLKTAAAPWVSWPEAREESV